MVAATLSREGASANHGARPSRARRLVALARACHPGPVAVVSLTAVGYAAAVGCTRRNALRVGFAVLSGQLAIGWHNDWTDAERDRRSGRTDKPIPNGEIARDVVRTAAVIAGISCVPVSLANGSRAGLSHLAAVASAIAYNARLKATPASFVPYGLSFSLLPIFVHQSRNTATAPPWWAPSAAGTLGVAAHLLNVLPDRDLDRSTGVLGLPQRLSREEDIALAGLLLLVSSALVNFGPRGPSLRAGISFVASTALVAASVRYASLRHDRTAFRLNLVLALVDVAGLLVGSRQNPEED